jgi:hypothetical protein
MSEGYPPQPVNDGSIKEVILVQVTFLHKPLGLQLPPHGFGQIEVGRQIQQVKPFCCRYSFLSHCLIHGKITKSKSNNNLKKYDEKIRTPWKTEGDEWKRG